MTTSERLDQHLTTAFNAVIIFGGVLGASEFLINPHTASAVLIGVLALVAIAAAVWATFRYAVYGKILRFSRPTWPTMFLATCAMLANLAIISRTEIYIATCITVLALAVARNIIRTKRQRQPAR